MMLALHGPEAPLNVWFREKRNVKADLKKLFGVDLRTIDAAALMTDTSQQRLPGQFSQIVGYFVSYRDPI